MSAETSCYFGHLLLVSNHRRQYFLKSPLFYLFSHTKRIRNQIWPCRKIGQGQLRDIIWINFVVLMHPMLQSKFQGHRLLGSREEDFLRFLPYMDMAAILVMWPGPLDKLSLPHPYEIWLQSAQWFQRRRCLKMLTYTHTSTHMDNRCLPIL